MDRGMFAMCVLDLVQMAHQGVGEWDVYPAGGMSLLRTAQSAPPVNTVYRDSFSSFFLLSSCWWRSEAVSLLSISPSGRQANPDRGPWCSTASDDVMRCDMNIVLNMCTCKTNSPPPGASITLLQAKYVPSRTTNNRNRHCKEHTVFIRMCSFPIWNMLVCQTNCI